MPTDFTFTPSDGTDDTDETPFDRLAKPVLKKKRKPQPNNPLSTTADEVDQALNGPNGQKIRKFFDGIKWAEGGQPDLIVGGKQRFDPNGDHPNVVGLTTSAGPSTAAGNYQITGSNWFGTKKGPGLKQRLGAKNFDEENQLRAAAMLYADRAKRNGVDPFQTIANGDYDTAAKIAAKDWASVPGSPLTGRQRAYQDFIKRISGDDDQEQTPFDKLLANAQQGTTDQTEETPFDKLLKNATPELNPYNAPTGDGKNAPTAPITQGNTPLTLGTSEDLNTVPGTSTDVEIKPDTFEVPVSFNNVPKGMSKMEYFTQQIIPKIAARSGLDAIDIENQLREKGFDAAKNEDFDKADNFTFYARPEWLDEVAQRGIKKRAALAGALASGMEVGPGKEIDTDELSNKYSLDPTEIQNALSGKDDQYKPYLEEGQRNREKYQAQLKRYQTSYNPDEPPSTAYIRARRDMGWIDPNTAQGMINREKILQDKMIQESQSGFGKYASYSGQETPEEVQARIAQETKVGIDSLIDQYGSLANYDRVQEILAKKYENRPLAQPLDFAVRFANALPQAVASGLKTLPMLSEAVALPLNKLTSYVASPETTAIMEKAFKADQSAPFKLGQSIDDYFKAQENRDFDSNKFQAIVPNALGQLTVQMIAGLATGGALLPTSIGMSMGAAQQYEDAAKYTDKSSLRLISALAGAAAAAPDAFVFNKWFSALKSEGKIGFIDKLAKSVYGRLGIEYGEDTAEELTKITVGTWVKKMVEGGAFEGTQEFTENKINDLVAIATYDASEKRKKQLLSVNEDDVMSILGGIVGGIAGGGVETHLEKVASNDLMGAYDSLPALLAQNKIDWRYFKAVEPIMLAELQRRADAHDLRFPVIPLPLSKDAVLESVKGQIPLKTTPKEKLPKDLAVPTTEAEPEKTQYTSQLDEIRQNNADTTAKVQALFPEAQLTRQEAAELRRQAWENYAPPTQEAAPTKEPTVETAPDETPTEETEFDKLLKQSFSMVDEEAPVKEAKIVGGGEVNRDSQKAEAAIKEARTSERTGLPNYKEFQKARSRIEADPNQEITSVDLNNFKAVNDQNSHIVGDQALNDAGQAFLEAAKSISPQAQIFHISGDEFVITSPKGTGQKIIKAADKIFSKNKYGEVTSSISGHTAQTYKEAEAGLQAAKAARKAKDAAKVAVKSKVEPVVEKPVKKVAPLKKVEPAVSAQDIHKLAKDKGLNIESPVFHKLSKEHAGVAKLDSMSAKQLAAVKAAILKGKFDKAKVEVKPEAPKAFSADDPVIVGNEPRYFVKEDEKNPKYVWVEDNDGNQSRVLKSLVKDGTNPELLKGMAENFIEKHRENPNFESFFKGSKVVDHRGNPLVVMHGAIDFQGNEFSPKETVDFGFHFGDIEQANSRTRTMGDFESGIPFHKSELIPTILRIKKPLRLEDRGFWSARNTVENIKDNHPGLITDEEGAKIVHESYNKSEKTAQNSLINLLESKGYDGIVYQNAYEGEEHKDSWIAFRPEQVKSVFNKGTFGANPDLLHAAADKAKALGATGTAEQWINRNENTIKNWNDFLNNKIPGTTGLKLLSDRVEGEYKEKVKQAKRDLEKIDLDAYLKQLADGNANVDNEQIQQAVWAYRQDPKAANKKLTKFVADNRRSALEDWTNYLEKENAIYKADPFFRDWVFTDLMKLRPGRPDLPSGLDKAALAAVYDDVKTKPNASAFQKLYDKKVTELMLQDAETSEILKVKDGTWIKIPQTKPDSPDFNDNVSKVQAVSNKAWCTSQGMAKAYLPRGDFWVLIKNQKSELAIRFEGAAVAEIQGKENNGTIPEEFLPDVKALIQADKVELTISSMDQVIRALKQSKFNARTKAFEEEAKDLISKHGRPLTPSNYTEVNNYVELAHNKLKNSDVPEVDKKLAKLFLKHFAPEYQEELNKELKSSDDEKAVLNEISKFDMEGLVDSVIEDLSKKHPEFEDQYAYEDAIYPAFGYLRLDGNESPMDLGSYTEAFNAGINHFTNESLDAKTKKLAKEFLDELTKRHDELHVKAENLLNKELEKAPELTPPLLTQDRAEELAGNYGDEADKIFKTLNSSEKQSIQFLKREAKDNYGGGIPTLITDDMSEILESSDTEITKILSDPIKYYRESVKQFLKSEYPKIPTSSRLIDFLAHTVAAEHIQMVPDYMEEYAAKREELNKELGESPELTPLQQFEKLNQDNEEILKKNSKGGPYRIQFRQNYDSGNFNVTYQGKTFAEIYQKAIDYTQSIGKKLDYLYITEKNAEGKWKAIPNNYEVQTQIRKNLEEASKIKFDAKKEELNKELDIPNIPSEWKNAIDESISRLDLGDYGEEEIKTPEELADEISSSITEFRGKTAAADLYDDILKQPKRLQEAWDYYQKQVESLKKERRAELDKELADSSDKASSRLQEIEKESKKYENKFNELVSKLAVEDPDTYDDWDSDRMAPTLSQYIWELTVDPPPLTLEELSTTEGLNTFSSYLYYGSVFPHSGQLDATNKEFQFLKKLAKEVLIPAYKLEYEKKQLELQRELKDNPDKPDYAKAQKDLDELKKTILEKYSKDDVEEILSNYESIISPYNFPFFFGEGAYDNLSLEDIAHLISAENSGPKEIETLFGQEVANNVSNEKLAAPTMDLLQAYFKTQEGHEKLLEQQAKTSPALEVYNKKRAELDKELNDNPDKWEIKPDGRIIWPKTLAGLKEFTNTDEFRSKVLEVATSQSQMASLDEFFDDYPEGILSVPASKFPERIKYVLKHSKTYLEELVENIRYDGRRTEGERNSFTPEEEKFITPVVEKILLTANKELLKTLNKELGLTLSEKWKSRADITLSEIQNQSHGTGKITSESSKADVDAVVSKLIENNKDTAYKGASDSELAQIKEYISRQLTDIVEQKRGELDKELNDNPDWNNKDYGQQLEDVAKGIQEKAAKAAPGAENDFINIAHYISGNAANKIINSGDYPNFGEETKVSLTEALLKFEKGDFDKYFEQATVIEKKQYLTQLEKAVFRPEFNEITNIAELNNRLENIKKIKEKDLFNVAKDVFKKELLGDLLLFTGKAEELNNLLEDNPDLLRGQRELYQKLYEVVDAPFNKEFFASDFTAKFDKDGNLEISPKVAEVIRRAESQMVSKRLGKIVKTNPFVGVMMRSSQLKLYNAAFHELYATTPKSWTSTDLKNFTNVLAKFKEAIQNKSAIVYVDPDLIPHEMVHKLRYQFSGYKEEISQYYNDFDKLFKSQRMVLVKSFNSYFKDNYYRSKELRDLTRREKENLYEETLAHILAEDYDKLGIEGDEIDKFLAADISAYVEKNGEDIIPALEKWINEERKSQIRKSKTSNELPEATQSAPSGRGESGDSGVETNAGQDRQTTQESPDQNPPQVGSPGDQEEVKPRAYPNTVARHTQLNPDDLDPNAQYYIPQPRSPVEAQATEWLRESGISKAYYEAFTQPVTALGVAKRQAVMSYLDAQISDYTSQNNLPRAQAVYDQFVALMNTIAPETTEWGQALSQMVQWSYLNPDATIYTLENQRDKAGKPRGSLDLETQQKVRDKIKEVQDLSGQENTIEAILRDNTKADTRKTLENVLKLKQEAITGLRNAFGKKRGNEDLLKATPENNPELLKAGIPRSIDELDPLTRQRLIDLGKIKYLEGKLAGGQSLQDWKSSVINELEQNLIDSTGAEPFLNSAYVQVREQVKRDNRAVEIERVKRKYNITNDREAIERLASEKAIQAAKSKIDAQALREAKKPKENRKALDIAIDNEYEGLSPDQLEEARKMVSLVKDKNAFYRTYQKEGNTPKEVTAKYLDTVEHYLNITEAMREARAQVKINRDLKPPGGFRELSDKEEAEYIAELKRIRSAKAKALSDFNSTVKHLTYRPETLKDRLFDWYLRVNRAGETMLTSALSTTAHNVGSQRATKLLHSFETAVELALAKFESSLGVDIFTKDKFDINDQTKFRNIFLEELKSSTFPAVRQASKDFLTGKAGLIEALKTIVMHKDRVVQGLLAHNPDLYDDMISRFSYGMDVDKKKPIDQSYGKLARGVEHTVRGVEKWAHLWTTLNRLQENHFKTATFLAIVTTELKARGLDPDMVIKGGNIDVIPREVLEKAVKRAAEDTFSEDIPKDNEAMRFINTVSNEAKWIPFGLNPLLFRRFLFNSTKFMLEHSPVVLAKAAGPGVTKRDISKAMSGMALFTLALGLLSAYGSDDEDPMMLTINGVNIRMEAYNPLSSFLVLANILKRYKEGRPPIKDIATIWQLFGINTRYPNLALQWYQSLVDLQASDNPSRYTKFNEKTLSITGKSVAAYLQGFSTLKAIQASFDDEEATQRDYIDEPFLGEIKKKLPASELLTRTLTGKNTPNKEIALTGEADKKEHTFLDQMGLTLIPDRQMGPKFTPAEEYLDDAMARQRQQQPKFYKSPAERRSSAIVAQLYAALDKGVNINTIADRAEVYVKQGLLSKNQAEGLIAAAKSPDTLTRKAVGSTIPVLVNALELAKGKERDILMGIIAKKVKSQAKNKTLSPDELRVVTPLFPELSH